MQTATPRGTQNFPVGYINATSSGRVASFTLIPVRLLAGRVKTTAFGRIGASRAALGLTGRAGATSFASLARFQVAAAPAFAVATTVSRSFGSAAQPNWGYAASPNFSTSLATARSSGRLRQFTEYQAGRLFSNSFVHTSTFGRLSRPGEFLSARILAASAARSPRLTLRTLFSGRITSAAFARFVPTQPLFHANTLAISFAYIPPLPILPTIELPLCPLDLDLDDYLNLITSEHIGKPRYVQSVAVSVQPYVDNQFTVNSFSCLFDVDVAVGEQEDYTGQWIGKTRFVNLGDVFFSWDVQGLGWDEANWQGPFDPPNALARLDDYHYRLLLYATIAANHWDGSIPSAYRAWDTLFDHTGYQVVIQDYGDMTMILALKGTGHIDAVTQALFENGNMDLKPEGVVLRDYMFQAQAGVPFFAWDAHSDTAAGWDIGYWGHLVPPGQGFIPE